MKQQGIGERKTDQTESEIKQAIEMPELLGDIVNNGTYYFEEKDGEYVSNNKGVQNSNAYSYIAINLVDYSGELFKLTVNAQISSSYEHYGNLTISDTTKAINIGSGTFVRISGTSKEVTAGKNYTRILEGGKQYYLHMNYYKNSSTSSNVDDEFVINTVKIEKLEEIDKSVMQINYIEKGTNKEIMHTKTINTAEGTEEYNLTIEDIKTSICGYKYESNEDTGWGSNKRREVKIYYSKIDTSKWDRVNIVKTSDGYDIPVPIGYVASEIEGENNSKTGFVIYEGEELVDVNSAWDMSMKRNQWVWVPVSDVSRIWDKINKKSKLYNFTSMGRTIYNGNYYEPGYVTSYSSGSTECDNEGMFAQYNMQGMTREKLYEQIKMTLEETVKSIEKYGGYYIGRYETGNVTTNEYKKDTYYGRPVVQRMNEKINYVSWYEAYSKMKYLGAKANVKASMISGALWDETLQWFIDSEAKTYEEIDYPLEWGNYNDSSFTYTTVAGGTSNKNSGNHTMVPTGSSEHNKCNNVYDIAGNVGEWTLEYHYSFDRIYRGEYFDHYASASPAYDRFNRSPNSKHYYIGVRAYFYIK